MHQYSHYRGPRRRRERERASEKIFEEVAAENIPNMGKESRQSPGSTESPEQHELKEVHSKTLYLKCQKLKIKRILKAARRKFKGQKL